MYDFLHRVVCSHVHVHYQVKEKKKVLLPYVSGHSVYKICNTDKHLLASLIWLSDKKEIIKLSAKRATVNKDKPFDISSNR